MKKLMVVLIILCLILVGMRHASNKLRASDAYIRDRVLQLKSREGSCSAVEVHSRSGMVYTLSAAHCKVLIEDGGVMAFNEQNVSKHLKMLQIDYANDLMLLEAFDNKAIDVAKNVYKHERVRVLAHGRGYPTYRVDGELLGEELIHVGEPLTSQATKDYCDSVPGSDIEYTMFGAVCMFTINEMQSSATIQPGASGGPVLNNKGELVGIVSTGDGIFSGFVPLAKIHDFLKD